MLLDTHTLIWALTEPERLSPRVRILLEDQKTEIFVSAVSAWEIATKHRLGKLPEAGEIVESYAAYVSELGAVELPISAAHALLAGRLPTDHRDPFDRMLAAQAVIEQLPLVSQDGSLSAFPIAVIW